MIRLHHMTGEEDAQIFVKFEAVNVGASIKTRTALGMIKAAEREGKITKETIIVEPTSGNQGIGLALIGAVRGYRTIIIMPDSVSEERRKLVRQYGAEVRLIHDAGNIGECIRECMDTALRMAAEDPRIFVPQQFENQIMSVFIMSGRGRRFWSRQIVRWTDFAPVSEQEEQFQESERH